MTLDLVQVAERLPQLVDQLKSERGQSLSRLAHARICLERAAADPTWFDARVLAAQSSWTLARLYAGSIDGAYEAPPLPDSYAALAVDGSSIDVDHHEPVECYVLNFGWMRLRYGAAPLAEAGSSIALEPTGGPLRRYSQDDPSRESSMAGEVLSTIRSVRELAKLAELAGTCIEPDQPLLVLVDGNLALWNLDSPKIPEFISDDLRRQSLEAFDTLRRLAEEGRLLFSGYVSGTAAANIVHSLRLIECPLEDPVVCKQCPGKETGTRPCDAAGVQRDRDLMAELLQPGERSAIFASHRAQQAQTAERWYELAGHEIVFFYLHTGSEIARVECPVWIADDPRRLDLLHALLVAQVRAGGSYPLALQEAHEQAVISTTDRRSFSALIRRECELNAIAWQGSAKSASKRTRSI